MSYNFKRTTRNVKPKNKKKSPNDIIIYHGCQILRKEVEVDEKTVKKNKRSELTNEKMDTKQH